jgi:O-acetyl-ADP-ribose deacetylase
MSIEILRADITTLAVDAIVNAAAPALLGGGGVDGAIHRAAGPGLLAACRALPEVRPGVRCPTGEVRLTAGFALPTAHVIHTVGPIWRGGDHGEATLLARCYQASLHQVLVHGWHSVAFPAISCGVYGYPLQPAATIAVGSLRQGMAQAKQPVRIVLCAFSSAVEQALRQALNAA